MDGPCLNRLRERQCGMQCHPSWAANSSSLRKSSPQLRLHISFLFLDEGKSSPTPPLQSHFTRAELFAYTSSMSKLLPNISWSAGHAEILTHCVRNAHTLWMLKISLEPVSVGKEGVLGFGFFTADYLLWLGCVKTLFNFSLIWLYFSLFCKGCCKLRIKAFVSKMR